MSEYARTLSRFADRLFRTGGDDPGDAAIALPPERLAVYHELIQGNYRSMIRFAFTATTRLMDHEAGRAAREGGVREVVAEFLATAPARTHSTREIAERFLAFVRDHEQEFLRRRPAVPDLMRVELAELRANYAADDPGVGATPERLAELGTADVDRFLATRVLRAPSASLLQVTYPAVHLRHEVLHRRFPPPLELDAGHVAVSRGPVDLLPVVRSIDPVAAGVLAAVPKQGVASLETVAGAWIDALPPDLAERDDAWKLTRFAQSIIRGLADGFLRLEERPGLQRWSDHRGRSDVPRPRVCSG